MYRARKGYLTLNSLEFGDSTRERRQEYEYHIIDRDIPEWSNANLYFNLKDKELYFHNNKTSTGHYLEINHMQRIKHRHILLRNVAHESVHLFDICFVSCSDFKIIEKKIERNIMFETIKIARQ